MVFSSALFIYLFLPIALIAYYLTPRLLRNYVLLLFSLVFYAWDGAGYTVIMLASMAVNYITGLLIEWGQGRKRDKLVLAIGIAVNLAILCWFKYLAFFLENINWIFKSKHAIPSIALPIGISFYTFHGISYIVDIYRRKSKAQRNIADLSLYITFFPQLVAGPIIRYHNISDQLRGRREKLHIFASGVERFILGLAKKVLLANTFAGIADEIFGYEVGQLTGHAAWLGIVAYTLQIYYDFSGYSDMAIGLARMFGFEFMENFNFPYIARSIQDFWHRWHISLSTWFRDYVYIPLGGSREGTARTYVNLFIVFLLTGFWHGASWSFVVWGLIHGSFIIIERLGFKNVLSRLPLISNIYTLLAVMFAWVFFRADTWEQAKFFTKALAGMSKVQIHYSETLLLINNWQFMCFAVGILGALGFFPFIYNTAKKAQARMPRPLQPLPSAAYAGLKLCSLVVLLLACLMYLAAESYNPFIYYRF